MQRYDEIYRALFSTGHHEKASSFFEVKDLVFKLMCEIIFEIYQDFNGEGKHCEYTQVN